MKEFGSDFHYVDFYNSGRNFLTEFLGRATFLAAGRQCIVSLIRQYGWQRLWMPDYYCYEVVGTIKEQTGIEVVMYEDSPLKEGHVETLPFEEGDVLLRINFFGMRYHRSNKSIPVPVIEDHSHDTSGPWALYSDADWCISSIRKTMPLPEGGIMWSPKQLKVESSNFRDSRECKDVAEMRWQAMEMKAAYLRGEDVRKEEFRKRYTETEEWFDHAEPAFIDERSRRTISESLDINLWVWAKRKNWKLLYSLINKDHCQVITAEHDSCTMFSMVLLMESKEQRDALRKRLIDVSVYPAILWNVPDGVSPASEDFSERMISIHCDGRYSEVDIRRMAGILNKELEMK